MEQHPQKIEKISEIDLNSVEITSIKIVVISRVDRRKAWK